MSSDTHVITRSMQSELLTTDELSARIKYDVRTILFVWDRIAEDIVKASSAGGSASIPMANGGVLHG